MKNLILAGLIGISGSAWAMTECAGYADSSTFVRVRINTTGVGVADNGEVVIERGGNKFGYRFTKENISQYFEYDDAQTGTVVGLLAHAQNENPVQTRYVGANFVDMDLKSVFDQGQAPKAKDNFLRAWKGPGHSSTDQYEVRNVVCSMWANL